MNGFVVEGLLGRSALRKTLQKHFAGISVADIVTAAREFPITSRIDVQETLERMLGDHSGAKLLGVHSQMGQETPTLAQLLHVDRSPWSSARCSTMKWISATSFRFGA
jgi:hypothetical protein